MGGKKKDIRKARIFYPENKDLKLLEKSKKKSELLSVLAFVFKTD